MKKGLLLLNLGTPDNPEPEAVGRYLREFLMDPRVIDIPWPVRWFLVNCLIVPKRRHDSSELYKTIWTPRGSPLLYHLRDLAEKIRPRLESQFEVAIAMRYGQPSIRTALEEFQKRGLQEIKIVPLYPQYAESTTLSSQEECERIARAIGLQARLSYVEPFYNRPGFIRPLASKVREVWSRLEPQHLVMSFHGLPERHVKRTDRSRDGHCLTKDDCSAEMNEANRDCYRAQCFATARELAIASGLAPDEYTVCFQSRLGRDRWIQPPTDETIVALGKKGIKRIAVVCPSFVSDCLETLEEIGIRGAEIFHENGGVEYTRIDCVNSDAAWVDGLIEIIGANPAMPATHQEERV